RRRHGIKTDPCQNACQHAVWPLLPLLIKSLAGLRKTDTSDSRRSRKTAGLALDVHHSGWAFLTFKPCRRMKRYFLDRGNFALAVGSCEVSGRMFRLLSFNGNLDLMEGCATRPLPLYCLQPILVRLGIVRYDHVLGNARRVAGIIRRLIGDGVD